MRRFSIISLYLIFMFMGDGFLNALWAWNSIGHRVIAQIAYDNMNDSAKIYFTQLNAALDKIYKPSDWQKAAVWLDTLRYQEVNWYNAMHYIDLPFSKDLSTLPPVNPINAVWAIENAKLVLLNKYSKSYDKAIALRILIHVVGDLHQPLHAATEVSKNFPQGDKGGNLFLLPKNPVAHNLHAYWDRGAGLLLVKKKQRQKQEIKRLTYKIEQKWPCKHDELTPSQWAQESHEIAIQEAYELPFDYQYQMNTQKVTSSRLALAGCRLAALLNRLDRPGT